MPRTVIFHSAGTQQTRATTAHRVYVKARWADAWVERPEIRALALQWSAAPTLPTARLRRRYGRALFEGNITPETVAPSDLAGYYVKIEVDVTADGTPNQDLTPLAWHGIIRARGDRPGGAVLVDGTRIPTGVETYTAYGLEEILSARIVDRSRLAETDDRAEADVERGLTFNAGGEPNRNLGDDEDELLFYSRSSPDVFFHAEPTYWSTRSIVRYLLRYFGPGHYNETLEWWTQIAQAWDLVLEEADAVFLPDDDAPILPTHGRTVRDLLNQLIPRHRGLSWFLQPAGDEVRLRVFSFLTDAVPLGEAGREIPANADQVILSHYEDPDAAVTITAQAVDQFEVVVAQGARRTNTFSAFFGQNMKAGWTEDEEAVYQAGASTWGDYPAAAEVAQRQRLDAIARSADSLRHVYARFDFDPDQLDWVDYTGINDPRNGEIRVVQLWPKDGDDQDSRSATTWPGGWRLLDYVPIPRTAEPAELVDGSAELGRTDFAQPIALMPWPADQFSADPRWARLDRLGDQARIEAIVEGDDPDKVDATWSAVVRPDRDRPAVWLHVSGAPAHVLDSANFVGTDVDEDLGGWDYNYMLATVAAEDDRFCRAVYPPLEIRRSDSDADHERVLLIDVGDDYRLDWIARGTVVGIDTEEKLYRVSEGYFLRDDRAELERIAQAAYLWYGRQRRAMTLTTRFQGRPVPLGCLVAELESWPGTTVEMHSAVTSIAILFPEADASAPMVTYETQFAELDVLKL